MLCFGGNLFHCGGAFDLLNENQSDRLLLYGVYHHVNSKEEYLKSDVNIVDLEEDTSSWFGYQAKIIIERSAEKYKWERKSRVRNRTYHQ